MRMDLMHWSDPAFDAAAPSGLRARIEALNAFVAPERLRRYQADLLRTGRLDWPDPVTGEPVACSGTAYIGVKAFAWRFATVAGPMWLTTGAPTHGYELSGLLLPDGHFFRFDQYEERETAGQQLKAIAVAERAFAGGSGRAGALQACLVAGHENFAHFMWNEMPALIEAETATGTSVAETAFAENPPCEIWATWEPIAPLDRLVRLGPVKRISARDLLAPPGGLHPAILFAAGATRMSQATKTRLIEACGTTAQRPDRFTLWLSLRLTHRRPVNQVPVFATLLTELASLPFPVEVIFDGHSLAADLDFPNRHYVEDQRRSADAVADLATQLKEALPADTAARLVVTDATRLSLPDSIALAGQADFYVCHHGTQQHKIGWIYPTPGVIHAPPYILRTMPAGWTQHQSEGAALPEYVPESLVVGDPGPTSDVPPNRESYQFPDAAGLTAFIIDRLRPVAAARGLL